MFRTGKRHKLTSEAGKRNERGVDPTICEVAADRVAELLTTYGGGTVAPGVTVVGTPPEPPRDHACAPSCRDRSPGCRSRPSASSTRLRGDRRRRRRRPTLLDGHTAAVAARPDRPLRPGRGGRPGRRLRPGAVGAARCRRSVAASPASSGCVAGSAAPSPRSAASRWSASRSSATRPSTRSGCPPTTCSATPSGSPTRSRRRSRSTPPPCCPASCDAAARNLGRGATGRRAVRDRHGRLPRRPRAGARVRRRLAAQRGRAGEAVRGDPCPAALPGVGPVAASASPAGWWGGGRAGRLVGRGRDRPRARSRARRRRTASSRPSGCPGTRAGAPGVSSATRSSATPASSTPGCARRSACPAAARRSRSTSTS